MPLNVKIPEKNKDNTELPKKRSLNVNVSSYFPSSLKKFQNIATPTQEEDNSQIYYNPNMTNTVYQFNNQLFPLNTNSPYIAYYPMYSIGTDSKLYY
jgi:hypothetical protein